MLLFVAIKCTLVFWLFLKKQETIKKKKIRKKQKYPSTFLKFVYHSILIKQMWFTDNQIDKTSSNIIFSY